MLTVEQKCDILLKIEPFNYLNEEQINQIARHSREKKYDTGSYVFRAGESSHNTLYVIVEGEAEIEEAVSREQPIAGTRHPGDFFGETVFLTGEQYPVSVVAKKPLTCLAIPRQAFTEIVTNNHEFASFFTRLLAGRLKELYHGFVTGDPPLADASPGQPLRKQVREVMQKNVATCLALDKIPQVAGKMKEADVSSLVVVAPNLKPVGIITEKDLVKKVLAEAKPFADKMAYEVMSTGLITVSPHDFLYQALLLMVKHKIKHVVVVEGEKLAGIVTVQDLVRNRNTGALSIIDRIESQSTVQGLAAVIKDIDRFQQALLTERAYASEICALVTEFYDRVTRKVIFIAEQKMAEMGWSKPPVKYCYINMGSAGRKEQYARTDQDNGIIYDNPPESEAKKTEAYFLQLGEYIVQGLEECGFKRCVGSVMANNPAWCKSLDAWRRSVREWLDNLRPENIRNMTIFLDFRYLVGEISLFTNLKQYTTDLFRKDALALKFLADDELQHHVPLNIFKQFITERSGKNRNTINLKVAVSVHLLDCIRLFALREGIKETNTFDRIKLLTKRDVFNPEDAESFETAYETVLMMRIRQSLQQIKQGLEPNNLVNPAELNRREQSLLRESLLVANRLQQLTAHAFRAITP